VNIYSDIKRLINYGLDKGLIYKEDKIYAINRILEVLNINEYKDIDLDREELDNPQGILNNILDYAYENGLIKEDTVTYRDLFDSRIMDCLMPRPSEVIRRFYNDYKDSPVKATSNYYELSRASNYIRNERINKNISWKTKTKYGELEITINLSKPEKDPRAIAASKAVKSSSYPKCLLCKENEGYSGRINHPSRHNHRIIPINLADENWFFQFSPYVYYNEHSIVFKGTHEPMKITEKTFIRLLEFVEKFPHYFIGSNADLPIVGGSILSHDHFQGGYYKFPMEDAPIIKGAKINGYEDIEVGIVKWPLSVIRMRSISREKLAKLGGKILEAWRSYSNKSMDIISHSKGEPHNTITPIARYRNNKFELDLVLRNNRTSKEHPLGIFHPHSDVQNIKKENIGLIEVMGLAVLPGRLKGELELLKECLLGNKEIKDIEELNSHRDWFLYLKGKYKNKEVDYDNVLREEVGRVFERVLHDAGVFKDDDKGLEAFYSFLKSV